MRPDRLLPDAEAEIASPDLPGDCLLACISTCLCEEPSYKRKDLLLATEAILAEIARFVRRPRFKPRSRDQINRWVGR